MIIATGTDSPAATSGASSSAYHRSARRRR